MSTLQKLILPSIFGVVNSERILVHLEKDKTDLQATFHLEIRASFESIICKKFMKTFKFHCFLL